MSTKVTTAHPEMHPGTYLSLDAYTSENVNVGIGPGRIEGMHLAGINVPRADLLAAVSSELGVVIIDKADQPKARLSKLSTGVVEARGFARSLNADSTEVRADGYALLAIADYIDGHVPPVNEAQVKALAEIVRTATDTPAGAYIGADLTAEGIARRLVATGKVEVRS